MRNIIIIILLSSMQIVAGLPQKLPGVEISSEEYHNYMVENSVNNEKDILSIDRKGYEINQLMLSWYAPTISAQIALDTGSIKLGMGAIFVPRMSEKGAVEPAIIIKDYSGNLVKTGNTGEKFNLLPGIYNVHIGNLTKFPIIKRVVVAEGKITPITPDWCALRVEVINENSKPIRGTYDLAKLNPLTLIGRGHGRDVDIAEDLRIWFLPIGTYKIVGVGASLNSISNFLTVRLPKAGEFVSISVVQDEKTEKILGGGVISEENISKKNRKWSNSFNIGGSLDFDIKTDEIEDSTTNEVGFLVLMYNRFNYKSEKFEINSLVKFDLNMNLKKLSFVNSETKFDEIRATTLFTYSLLSFLGPYGRAEYISGIVPKNSEAPTIENDIDLTHTFIFYQNQSDIISDETYIILDSVSDIINITPRFSPIQIQTGVGVNLQIFRNNIANIRFLTGLGLSYNNSWNSWSAVDDDKLTFDKNSNIYKRYYEDEVLHTNLINSNSERFDYGPEFVLNSYLSLSRLLSIDTDIRLFAPIERVKTPDLVIRNLVSLHLTGAVSIDYDYKYKLIQAKEEELKEDQNQHRVLIRVSFSY